MYNAIYIYIYTYIYIYIYTCIYAHVILKSLNHWSWSSRQACYDPIQRGLAQLPHTPAIESCTPRWTAGETAAPLGPTRNAHKHTSAKQTQQTMIIVMMTIIMIMMLMLVILFKMMMMMKITSMMLIIIAILRLLLLLIIIIMIIIIMMIMIIIIQTKSGAPRSLRPLASSCRPPAASSPLRLLPPDHSQKCTSKGIRRQGSALKHRSSLQTNLSMPSRQMPLLM